MSELINNKILNQYQTKIAKHTASVEYSIQDKKIFLGKTIIPDSFTEQETNIFIQNILDDCISQKLRIVPISSIVVKFIKNNKEYKEHLSAGIRI
ncbi:MAG: N-acetyltransferase [Bacteroidota bacterium]|nr:N-acetyltransferase [Bacteroidota bacterium]